MPITYKIALELTSANLAEKLTFRYLSANQRAFKIYRWNSDITYIKRVYYPDTNESGRPIGCWKDEKLELGGYEPWLFFTGKKWKKIKKENLPIRDLNRIMIPAHKFFTTEKNFKSWLGKKNYSNLFLDLI